MILLPIKISSDLSETALEQALSQLVIKHLPVTLVVSIALLDIAPLLCRNFKLTLHVETNLPKDAWYVYNIYEGVFSPGA